MAQMKQETNKIIFDMFADKLVDASIENMQLVSYFLTQMNERAREYHGVDEEEAIAESDRLAIERLAVATDRDE